MRRRSLLTTIAVAAVPAAGCLARPNESVEDDGSGSSTRADDGDGDDGDCECPPDADADDLERDELVEIVHLKEVEGGDDPRLEGVIVNFGSDQLNADVIAEFYREANGAEEIVGTRRVSVMGVVPRQGDPFSIPYPEVDASEELQFDLTVDVTAVFD